MITEPSADSATALNWYKSSYSGNEAHECVEVATSPRTVHVRDSKDPEGPSLAFAPDAWAAFLGYAAEQQV
ncbi:DUF397 domain-containing protein [Streptomyces sp. NRRL F-5123]|uniref:DUF397 domain-containing protein n=1 Tax=Streptomyces sp. NRRL F-5123 TaxID=1463856 RepID=UPI0004E172D1|nr:DUF397 domain-containing protein [Streptomyces sp. NRRL F-5123]